MKVIILEDEAPAAERLKKMLLATAYAVEVAAVLPTLSSAVAWLAANPLPDLIFMDIELGDGLSVDLVKRTRIDCPVIFVTAYDEYWQEAFEYNSLDYLLKPLKKERLEAALHKFNELKEYFAQRYRDLQAWREPGPKFRSGFFVRRGIEHVSIKTTEIAFFYATHKMVCLVRNDGSKFILDQSLADIEKQVDPVTFYRVNRKYLVHLQAVRRIHSLPKSKLVVEVAPAIKEEIIVSSENSAGFKKWLVR
jgi:two-component system, LytTR family, response regulator